jgi:hypothetical protein
MTRTHAGIVAAVVVMSALGGIVAGVQLAHGPAATPRQSPAAVVQQLDPTSMPTGTTSAAPATTEDTVPSTTNGNVTIITDDPKHPVTVITGPSAAEGHPLVMPTPDVPIPTTTYTPPVVTPEMPPGYPGSPSTPESTPTN